MEVTTTLVVDVEGIELVPVSAPAVESLGEALAFVIEATDEATDEATLDAVGGVELVKFAGLEVEGLTTDGLDVEVLATDGLDVEVLTTDGLLVAAAVLEVVTGPLVLGVDDGLPAPPAAEPDELEVVLATLLVEEPIVTVTDQLRVMVDKTVVVLEDGLLGELVELTPAAEMPVGGSTPLEIVADGVAVCVKRDVVTDVKVRGQTVVETGTTEVRMDADPLSGQLVTEAGQLRTVTSLVE